MSRFVCIHGHFYQPPRENPWLEDVERQDSATPFHDWNQRITEECYAPNTAARILDDHKYIVDIVNNYGQMSFNYGPTLLSWMKRHKPEVYRQILDSDLQSRGHFSGHGSALAQCYNHMIMPLANERDRKTQVLWGIRDFESRFKRKPEGMWLPETAVDLPSLEALAEQGIRFTILAPRQAQRIRKIGEKEWIDISGERIDPKQAYQCALPSGRTIALFFYDGPISKDIAFGNLLDDGSVFARRLADVFETGPRPQLVHVATDGESYGHHHRFGDMALAFCLKELQKKHDVRLTVYGEFLEKHPPEYEVEIAEDSSWSCIHGVERWRADCGCCSGGHPGWHQKWRAPLRKALDALRDSLAEVFEREMAPLFNDPWEARDGYIDVILDRSPKTIHQFFKRFASSGLNESQRIKALHLLEMQRHAMLMYTSCGWFFDEISGIETIQILQYAAKALQLQKEVTGEDLSFNFVGRLKEAPSNRSEYGNGANLFREKVLSAVLDIQRVGAHYAIMSLFEEFPETLDIYCYEVSRKSYVLWEQAQTKLAFGEIVVRSKITDEQRNLFFSVLYLGGHDLFAAVSETMTQDEFQEVQKKTAKAYRREKRRDVVRFMKEYFEKGPFSLRHLFKDDQTKILYQLLDDSLHEVETCMREINEHHRSIIEVVQQLHVPLPSVLANTVSVMLNTDMLRILSVDPIDFKRLKDLVDETLEWKLEIDRVTVAFFVSRRLKETMDRFSSRPKDVRLLRQAIMMLRTMKPLKLNVNLGKPQNIYFITAKNHYDDMKRKALQGNSSAQRWKELFEELGRYLRVALPGVAGPYAE